MLNKDQFGALHQQALTKGGFSSTLAGETPHTGYMVSQVGTNVDVPVEQSNPGTIMHFANRYRSHLTARGAHLGGWVDKGKLELDVSTNIASKDIARKEMVAHHQTAMYDVKGESDIHNYLKAPRRLAMAIPTVPSMRRISAGEENHPLGRITAEAIRQNERRPPLAAERARNRRQ